MRVSEQLGDVLARAVEQSADLIEISDGDGRLLHVNARFVELIGAGMAALLGKTPRQLVDDGVYQASFADAVWQAISARTSWTGRTSLRMADGAGRSFDTSVLPIIDDGGRISHHVTLRRDVTSHDELQASAFQAERLRTVGQLATGVAHEINNPLAYLLANVNFLSDCVESLGDALGVQRRREIATAIADIEHGAMRIRDIVRDLGTFSTDEERTGPIDVCEVLDATLKLLVNEIKHRAQLVRELREVPMVWADRGRLGQVFLSVLLNAAQAIPVGSAYDNVIRVTVGRDQRGRVIVSVADSGEGIAREDLDRVFDPFFTTRPLGQGTGLGLAVSHRIVTAQGGEMRVDCPPSGGTVVTIVLRPMHEQIRAAPEAPRRMPARTAGGRILLIDDEPGLLRAMRRMLRGYEVATASSGREGRDRLLAEDFDVVFCDVMMPDTAGLALYEDMRAERPAMAERFVFMTGGAFTAQAREFLRDIAQPVIVKPFSDTELRAIVDEMLRSPPEPR